MDGKTLTAMGATIVLIVLITLSALRLVEAHGNARSIDALGEKSDPRTVLAEATTLKRRELTPKQKKRLDDLVTLAASGALAEKDPVRNLGAHPTSPRPTEALVFRGQAGRVSASVHLEPPTLARYVTAIRVGDSSKEIGPETAETAFDVVLPKGSGVQELRASVTLELPSGAQTSIALPPLRFRFETRAPTIELEVGGRKLPSGTTAVVPADSAVTIVATDADVGVVRVSVAVDGQELPAGRFETPSQNPVNVALPRELLQVGARTRRSVTVVAANAGDNQAQATFALDLRPAGFHPVRAIHVNDGVAPENGVYSSRDRRLRVRAEVDEELLSEASGLELHAPGSSTALRKDGNGLVGDLEIRDDGEVTLEIRGPSLPVLRRTVKIDTTGPKTVVRVDGGEALPANAETEVARGATVTVEVEDASGVPPAKVAVSAGGFTVTPGEGTKTRWTATLTLASEEPARLEIAAEDGLGNPARGAWTLRPRTPFELREVTLGGRKSAPAPLVVRGSKLRLEAVTVGTGGLRVAWADEGGAAPQVLVTQPFQSGGTWSFDVDLGGLAEGAPRRLVVADEGGARALAVFTVVVDRTPPALSVRGLDAAPEAGRGFVADPGQTFRIVAEDGHGVASVALDGGPALTDPSDGGGFAVTAPTTLPAECEVRALDLAGNEARFAFRIAPRPAPVATPTPLEPSTNPAPPNPTLPNPPPPPVETRPTPPPPPLAPSLSPETRDRVKAALAAAEARTPGAEALLEAARTTLAACPNEAADIEDIVRLRKEVLAAAEALAARAAAESSLAERMTNAKDGAVLLLVRTPAGRPRFAAFYAYETEVTCSMWHAFTTETSADEAFWAKTAPAVGKLSGGALKQQALFLSERKAKSSRPMTELSPELARCYAAWASAGLPSGRLVLPTDEEWRLAAGRALHADAVFPTTGRYADGTKLLGREFEGDRGGSAIEFRPNVMPPTVKTYAPGAFGLYDMAGSAWEWVGVEGDRFAAAGGGHTSTKAECRLDAFKPAAEAKRSEVGFRLFWRP